MDIIFDTNCFDLYQLYGIKTSIQDNLSILNYTGKSEKFNPVSDLCRGLIIDRTNRIVVCRCMKRFYNINEYTSTHIEGNVLYSTKYDGTYIQIYCYKGIWYVSTRNAIISDDFSSKVISLFGSKSNFQQLMTEIAHKNNVHTFWFEYCGPLNKIITEYSETFMVFLGCVDPNGNEISIESFSVKDIISIKLNKINFNDITFNDLDEGFVIYKDNVKYKYKNKNWILLHSKKFNQNWKTILYEIIYNFGDIDEIQSILSEMKQIYVPFIKMINSINNHINSNFNVSKRLLADDPLLPWISHKCQFSELIIPNLKGNFKAQIQIINKLKTMNYDDIYIFTEEEFKNIKTIQNPPFVRIGCVMSTDIDICIITYNDKDFNSNFTFTNDIVYDINVVLISDGIVVRTKKGSMALTNNIIYYTFTEHDQILKECPVKRPVELDIHKMIHLLISTIMTGRSSIAPALYLKDRYKSEIYSIRDTYFITILNEYEPNADNKDQMKSIVMKFCQIILYSHREEEYQKMKLAYKTAEHLECSSDGILYHLTRGLKGKYDPLLLERLIIEYHNIFTPLTWNDFRINTENPCFKLSEELFKMFLDSPDVCTDQFIQLYIRLYGNSFHDLFLLPTSKFADFPVWIREHILCIEQRSDEWRQLYNYYTNGGTVLSNDIVSLDDTIVPPIMSGSFIENYYNLFRGAIAEMMIMNSNHEFKALTVGMIVRNIQEKGSIASCPDMLYVDEEENIYPVEIKCIVGTKSEFRAINLARKQLQKSLTIIREQRPRNPNIGYIIIVNAEKSLKAKITLIRF